MKFFASLLTGAVGWCGFYLLQNSYYTSAFEMPIIPEIGIIGTALYLLLPGTFDIGPAAENASKWSYLASGILTLIYVAIPLTLTPTVITASVSSFFLGAFFQYVGGALVESRKSKLVGRK